jgi:hypothetical protein
MTRAEKKLILKSRKTNEYASKRATHLSTLIYLNNVDGLFKEIDLISISINDQKLTNDTFGLHPDAIEKICTGCLQPCSITITSLNLISGLDPP